MVAGTCLNMASIQIPFNKRNVRVRELMSSFVLHFFND